MTAALYGPAGFFVSGTGHGPAGHFRTSVHTSPLLADAVLRLLARVDAALGHPDPLDVVDVGAGRGELLAAVAVAAPPATARRLRLTAVELAPRPPGLAPSIAWRHDLPSRLTGLLVATEWLDNVPLDVAEVGDDGIARIVLVDDAGAESAGPPVAGEDAAWLARWWPLAGALPGTRAEIGHPRDAAWAAAVAVVGRGLAMAVDYGHRRGARPDAGTLTGFRAGRQVPPVPDGGCDVTAHVAVDAVAEAGVQAGAGGHLPYTLVTQREALRALGVDGARPPLALAGTDPAGYVRALAAASAAAELTDPAGLGGHWWLMQPVGVDPGLLRDR
jgi:SAM-dependent MidA family methyltransferase